MTAPRPPDWEPLADSDPVPGDPVRVLEEAKHLEDVAEEMRQQIDRLRALGEAEVMQGRTAEALRAAAAELHGRLDATRGRYVQVAGALRDWEPVLRQAQADSLGIRDRAQAAAQTIRDNPGALEPGTPRTPDDFGRIAAQNDARKGASGALATERRQLDGLVDGLDDAARRCAERVRTAIDDGVADDWWDDVKDFSDRHAGQIDAVVEVLSVVATVFAVIAIFTAVPVAVPLLLGGAVLVGQTFLASTGNGSWADVGLSVFGLLTLGAGSAIAKGASSLKGVSGIQQATRAAGAKAARKAAEKTALQNSSPVRTAAGRTLNDGSATAQQRAGARRIIDEAKEQAREAGRTARQAELDRDLTPARARDRFAFDSDAARQLADIRGVQARFPNDSRVAEAAAGTGRRFAGLAAAGGAGLTTDVGDKVVEPLVPDYERYKDGWKKEVGSRW